jgi:hypothetical protein
VVLDRIRVLVGSESVPESDPAQRTDAGCNLLDVVVKEQTHSVEELLGRERFDPARMDVDFEDEMLLAADFEVALAIRRGEVGRAQRTASGE